MRATLTIYKQDEPTGSAVPVVVAAMDGDPVEMLDAAQLLNSRWPGRWAKLEVLLVLGQARSITGGR